MKLKALLLPAIVLLFGIVATIVGALFKIQHWPNGSLILTIGTILELLALLWALVIIIKLYTDTKA